jgi:uncharacterized protein
MGTFPSGTMVELLAVPIEKPDDVNLIIGQAHFIKTVEDLHEAMVNASAQLKFGIAFSEASGPCLVRRTSNDSELERLAVAATIAIGAGHCFVIMLRNGFPVNVLNAIKSVPEVCSVFCASANPVEVVVGSTGGGRGILGVVDGAPPKGIETDADIVARKAMLRKFGYKL